MNSSSGSTRLNNGQTTFGSADDLIIIETFFSVEDVARICAGLRLHKIWRKVDQNKGSLSLHVIQQTGLIVGVKHVLNHGPFYVDGVKIVHVV